MNYIKINLIIFFLVFGCSKREINNQKDIPQELKYLDNISILSVDEEILDSIELIQEVVFKSNDEVYIEGFTSGFDVDNRGRVFIAATMPNIIGIYAFNQDGKFLSRFANEGRGPGEYESINSIHIYEDQLFLFDPLLQKVGIFSTSDFKHIEDITLDLSLIKKKGELPAKGKPSDLLITDDGQLLIRFIDFGGRETSQNEEYYFELNQNGDILPNLLLKQKSYSYYYPDAPLSVPFLMPFSRSSIVAISNDNHFFSAWTENALIKVFDRNGNYESAFYIPTETVPVNMDMFNLSPLRKRTLDKYDLPKKWPKLRTMEFDDEGNLWVSLITKSDSTFKWIVLDKELKAVAHVSEPGDKYSNMVINKPSIIIKGGHLYVDNSDFYSNMIVKYKIIFITK